MKLKIKVQPNFSQQKIQFNLDGKIQKVFLKKQSTKNKANIELEKLLTKYFKATTKVIKGHASKNKTIEVKK